MQIDDILLLRMKRQYLFAPAKDEFTVLRGLCGLQAQFYGNCLHALRLRCGGKKILPVHAEQKHVVDLHGTPPFGANFPAGILAKNAVF